MSELISIVIVRNGPYGFTASLRYANRFRDADLVSNTKHGLHELIDRHVSRWAR